MRPQSYLTLFALLAVLATTIVLSQPSPGVSDEPTRAEVIADDWPALDAALAGEPLPDLVGTWSGTWMDTVFAAGGAITMDITQNGNQLSGTGTIDLTSIGLFGLGIMSGSATGSIVGNTLGFSFSADSVGMGAGTVTGGTASGGGNVTAPLNFGAFLISGTATSTTMQGIFDFTSPGAGGGTAMLTKTSPVEPQTWSEIKAAHRE